MRGSALMICMLPVSILALGTLPPERVKNASGLFNLMRNLGGAFGLAAINTALNKRWDLHIERLGEAVTWSRDAATEQLTAMTQGFQATLGSDAERAALASLSQIGPPRGAGDGLLRCLPDPGGRLLRGSALGAARPPPAADRGGCWGHIDPGRPLFRCLAPKPAKSYSYQ